MLPQKFSSAFEGLPFDFDSVLVALSGGSDSVSLLDMTARLADDAGFTVYAAHVNHNIRGEKYGNEANRDEAFCRELCSARGIKLFVLNANIPSLSAELGESTETVARNVRYDFFAKVMRENGIGLLLTAHNSNDNLETQIFNLCRGCGISGISGIPMLRGFPEADGYILRPILGLSKAQILDYCEGHSLSYVTDSTNASTDYTRNRIRHKIIPELEDMFDDPQRAGERLSLCAREDSDFIALEAEKIFSSFPKGRIPLDKFNPLHISLKRRILSVFFGEGLEYVHLNDLIELAKKAVPHSSLSLPKRKVATVEDSCLCFGNVEKQENPDYFIELHAGLNTITDCDFAVYVGEKPQDMLNIDGQIYRLYTFAFIKNATILSLSARTRREGDTIIQGGMTKKVKKLLCERKIPLSERDSLPFILCGEDIIYIPRCAVSDNFTTKNTKEGIFIYKTERSV